MSKKILLVEDEVSLRDVYSEVLRDAGYTVIEIGDGDTAIKAIEAGDWDLLLLDIMLPRLDGVEILKKMNISNSNATRKPVIVLSNLDSDAVVRQCLEYGACDYLIKSNIVPNQVLDVVYKQLPLV